MNVDLLKDSREFGLQGDNSTDSLVTPVFPTSETCAKMTDKLI